MGSLLAIVELAPERGQPIVEAVTQCGFPRERIVVLPVHERPAHLPRGTGGVIGSGGPGSVRDLGRSSGRGVVLRRGLDLLNKAISNNHSVMAICMSHQLLASDDGCVRYRPGGMVAGFETVRFSGGDDFLSKLPADVQMAELHHDEVHQIPAGWHVVASSRSCGIEAMRLAHRPVWSFQGHPELSASLLRRLLMEQSPSAQRLATTVDPLYDFNRLSLFARFLDLVEKGGSSPVVSNNKGANGTTHDDSRYAGTPCSGHGAKAAPWLPRIGQRSGPFHLISRAIADPEVRAAT